MLAGRLTRGWLTATLSVFLFAVVFVSPALGAGPPRVECLVDGKQTYRAAPRYCVLYEHGSPATTILTSMRWSDWGKRRTRGRGVIQFYDHPEYAGRVVVGLGRLRRGGCRSGRFYTDAHVHVVSGMAKGNVFDLRLAAGCPA